MAIDYGTDASGTIDVTPDGRMISGKLGVIQALVRRLSTRRGTLYRHPNYGYALFELLNSSMTPKENSAAQVAIANECTKDERVNAASASVTLSKAGTLTVTIVVDLGEGPFTFVLAVSDVTVTLLDQDVS